MTKEALETLIGHLEVWALIFGIIVVIGVAGESVFGIRIWWNSHKLQAIQRAENDVLQLKVSQANDRAKEAESHLGEAKSSAAQAEQHAAEANERAELAHKDAEGFRLQIGEATERSATAEKAAADDELALEELRKETAPRRVTAEQRKKFMAAWTTPAGHMADIEVMADSDVPDSEDFGRDLRDLLQDVAFSKVVFVPHIFMPEAQAEAHGITMGVGANRYGDANALAEALFVSGIASRPIPAFMAPKMPPNKLYLRVTKVPRRQVNLKTSDHP